MLSMFLYRFLFPFRFLFRIPVSRFSRRPLSMVPWHLIEQEYKPDNAWDIWQHMFLDIADYHAPLKKKRMRGVASPWITPELKKLIYQMRQTQKHSLEVPNRWQLDVLRTLKLIVKLRMLK